MDFKSVQVLKGFLTAALCVQIAHGASKSFCFRREQFSGRNCRGIPIQVQDSFRRTHAAINVSQDCCSDPNATYYTNATSQISILLIGVNCWPCHPEENPCENKVCTGGKVCIEKGKRKGKCVCLGCRDSVKRTVCGIDGRTYAHECELKRKACREGRSNVEVAYDGECKTGCEGVVCRKNRTCMIDQYKKAYCVSCMDCSKLQNEGGPVCGADGLQYESSCHLRMETCRRGKAIGLAYRGNCKENATCHDIKCETKTRPWELLEEKRAKKECVHDDTERPRCVRCSCEDLEFYQKSETVCGTDNKTYQDLCSLREEMCKTKKFIDVKHLKPCKGHKFSRPQQQQPPPETTTKPCDDLTLYYVSMKHFVGILIHKFGLNVTEPEYKKLPSARKVVTMAELIELLSKKWRKATLETPRNLR
ncbi:follistatin-A-like isoform X1 [Montipora foliosa]|uniref:follistatin-A-like isoform X1 n=1 Tax=Montipora foliosa TaxID=591990 RepID=UPI0035F1E0B6